MGQRAKRTEYDEQKETRGASNNNKSQNRPAQNNQGGSSNVNLEKKLEQLEGEWSYEKILKVAAAGFVIASVFLSVKHKKKIEEFSQSVASMLGVESLDEFNPPPMLLEKFGLRRQQDIDKEVEKLLSRGA